LTDFHATSYRWLDKKKTFVEQGRRSSAVPPWLANLCL